MKTQILYDPDAPNTAAGSSSQPAAGSLTTPDSSAATNPDAYDTAASEAVDVLMKSVSPADTKKDAESKDEASPEGSVMEHNKTAADADKDKLAEAEKSKLKSKDDEGDKTDKDKDKKDEADEETDESDEEEEVVEDADSKLPFHDHPRWKEVIAERDTAKSEITKVKAEYEAAKPVVEAHTQVARFCAENDISEQDYKDSLSFLALRRSDPAKALAMLEPMVEGLRAYTGKGIAADLVQDVKDGTLTEDRAKEITKLRAQEQFGKVTTQQQQVRAQQAQLQAMQTSVQTWYDSKAKSDTSMDKKSELVNAFFAQSCQAEPPRTAADVVSKLEAAYAKASKTIQPFVPKPKITNDDKLGKQKSRTTGPKPSTTLDEEATRLIDKAMNGSLR